MYHYIEKHDMEMVLDGLEMLRDYLKKFEHHHRLPYSAEEVEAMHSLLLGEKTNETQSKITFPANDDYAFF